MATNKQYNERFWKTSNLEAVQELNAIAQEIGMNIAELAMNWCDSVGYVDSILFGMSRLDQVKQNIAFMHEQPLSAEVLAKCDAVWAKLDDQSFKYNR